MAVPKKDVKNAGPGVPARSGKPGDSGAVLTAQTLMKRVNEVNSRLRLTEERINQNRERLRVFDDALLDNKKKINNNIKDIKDDVDELKKNIKMLGDNIQHIIKELELTAKKQDVTVIEKYVGMMDPTRYITKEEVLKLMKNG